jgi:hypothetical protein
MHIMIGSRFVTGGLLALLTLVVSARAVVFAHDVLYPGTVLSVEAERLHVKTVDPESKKDLNLWFAVTRDTRVKRGDRVVTYADAKIAKDERIVVVVNHDAEVKNVATELRLAATSGVARAAQKVDQWAARKGGVAAVAAAPATSTQKRPVDRAFAACDRIHAALAQDSMDGVAAAAKILQPLAVEISGAEAGRATAPLADVGDLDEARTRLATVSEALVPLFLDAGIPGLNSPW